MPVMAALRRLYVRAMCALDPGFEPSVTEVHAASWAAARRERQLRAFTVERSDLFPHGLG